jgi:hypothetical protein
MNSGLDSTINLHVDVICASNQKQAHERQYLLSKLSSLLSRDTQAQKVFTDMEPTMFSTELESPWR